VPGSAALPSRLRHAGRYPLRFHCHSLRNFFCTARVRRCLPLPALGYLGYLPPEQRTSLLPDSIARIRGLSCVISSLSVPGPACNSQSELVGPFCSSRLLHLVVHSTNTFPLPAPVPALQHYATLPHTFFESGGSSRAVPLRSILMDPVWLCVDRGKWRNRVYAFVRSPVVLATVDALWDSPFVRAGHL